MTRLEAVEGIGEVYAGKLRGAGIAHLEAYLAACATPKGREEMADKTGISSKLILEWANRADLFRIKGIGEEYSDLLEYAGVDTVPELAQRKPENLYEKLREVNAEKKLVRKLPSMVQVMDWVAQAKELPRALNY
jgi:predicted flap endonuclease-1-like 5' DNA nuclease